MNAGFDGINSPWKSERLVLVRNNEAYCTELHEFGGIRFAIPPYGPTTPGDCNDITQMAEFYLQRALSLLLSPDKEDAMEPFWKTGARCHLIHAA